MRLTLAGEGLSPRDRVALRGPHWSQHLEQITVTIRRAGDRRAEAVDAERRVLGMDGERIIELWPNHALEAQGRYHIVLSTPYDAPPRTPRGDIAKSSPRRYVTSFYSGTSLDESPPTWTGISSAQVFGRQNRRIVKADGSVIEWSDDLRSAPWLVAHAPAAIDDSTPQPFLIYAIWVARGTEPIGYGRAPLSYLIWRNGRILAGRDESVPERSICDFAVLSALDPRHPSPLRIGMRAVDLAGNTSAPSEIIVDGSVRGARP